MAESKFDTLKLATKYWGGDTSVTTLVAILFFLILTIFFVAGFIFQKKLREKNVRKYFIKYAKERDLTDNEIEILWNYSQKMDRDPILVLEFKAPFEKVIDLYIKNDPNADEEMIKDMRKKLGFEIASPYIPLVTTKDIELFQNARMIFANAKAISIALYDKDERYMYWLVVDNNLPPSIGVGEYVKVMFIRPEDGIYTFESPIEEIIKDGGKTIVKFAHSFDLERMQRREYPRIKTEKPAQIIYTVQNKEITLDGKFFDISAGGAKICFPNATEKSLLDSLSFGNTVIVKFSLEGNHFAIPSTVLDKIQRRKEECIRVNFKDIKDKEREKIMEFVQKEQLKLAQLRRG